MWHNHNESIPEHATARAMLSGATQEGQRTHTHQPTFQFDWPPANNFHDRLNLLT